VGMEFDALTGEDTDLLSLGLSLEESAWSSSRAKDLVEVLTQVLHQRLSFLQNRRVTLLGEPAVDRRQ
jgi:hypothetical protein